MCSFICGFDNRIIAHAVHIQYNKRYSGNVGVLDFAETTDQHKKAGMLLPS